MEAPAGGATPENDITLGRRLRAALHALRERPTTGASRDEAIDRAIDTLASASVHEIQDRGYHFQRRDYYSALNDLPFLAENRDLWHDRPPPRGIAWDLDAQLDEVSGLAPYLAELKDVPMQPPPGPPAYHWDNGFWRGFDALVHYGLLRSVKPRRTIEIGAGWSSLLMADALKQNEAEGSQQTEVTQIEPYPRRELLSALPDHWKLHDIPLQRTNLSLFETLGPGDVCFYDGSHVARAGSDVVWFFFEVLPRLQPGVLVHVHDIFWPADYPDEWIFEWGQTWNEQYVLQAFLMYNDSFEVLVSNNMLLQFGGEAVEDLFRHVSETQRVGASVWLKRTA